MAQLRRDNKRLTEEVEVLRVNRLSILIFHADQHAALLRQAGWHANDKRIERLWKREGLKVPAKQPKKGRLWFNDGSCVRLRPERPNHVWPYDFVHNRTHDGRRFRTLNIIDEFTRDCLMIRVKRRLNSVDVIDALTDLFILRGPPAFIRSDNGPEFVAEAVREWITAVGAQTAYIEPDRAARQLRPVPVSPPRWRQVRQLEAMLPRWRHPPVARRMRYSVARHCRAGPCSRNSAVCCALRPCSGRSACGHTGGNGPNRQAGHRRVWARRSAGLWEHYCSPSCVSPPHGPSPHSPHARRASGPAIHREACCGSARAVITTWG